MFPARNPSTSARVSVEDEHDQGHRAGGMKSLTRNAAEVRALLAGASEVWLPMRKQPEYRKGVGTGLMGLWCACGWNLEHLAVDGTEVHRCAPYAVGDHISVREPWWNIPQPSWRQLSDGADTWPIVAYDAEESEVSRELIREMGWKLRPAQTMPKEFSRITLTVLSVEARKTDAMTEGEALACGITDEYLVKMRVPPPRMKSFKYVWTARYGKRYLWGCWAFRYVVSVAVAGRQA